MMLPPMDWIVHVECTQYNKELMTSKAHTIEMVVQAQTAQEAQRIGARKTREFDYIPWAVRCEPLLNRKNEVLENGNVILLPAPIEVAEAVAAAVTVPPPPKKPDLFEDIAYFNPSITKPLYGKGITSDSLP